jgi:hypothetical protein
MSQWITKSIVATIAAYLLLSMPIHGAQAEPPSATYIVGEYDQHVIVLADGSTRSWVISPSNSVYLAREYNQREDDGTISHVVQLTDGTFRTWTIQDNSCPLGYNLTCGNFVYAPPSDFCAHFSCIDNFWNGHGYVVQCVDGMFSKSGGIYLPCNYHGGVWRPIYLNTQQ